MNAKSYDRVRLKNTLINIPINILTIERNAARRCLKEVLLIDKFKLPKSTHMEVMDTLKCILLTHVKDKEEVVWYTWDIDMTNFAICMGLQEMA